MLEVDFRCTSTEGCDETGLPVDGLEELALVCANFAGVDLLNEFRVFVDEPRFAQDVRCCVLQLQQPNVQNVTTSDLTIYTIVSVNSLRVETACYTHKKQLPLSKYLKAITLDIRRTQSSSRSVIKINKKKYDMVEWWIVRNFGLAFCLRNGRTRFGGRKLRRRLEAHNQDKHAVTSAMQVELGSGRWAAVDAGQTATARTPPSVDSTAVASAIAHGLHRQLSNTKPPHNAPGMNRCICVLVFQHSPKEVWMYSLIPGWSFFAETCWRYSWCFHAKSWLFCGEQMLLSCDVSASSIYLCA